MNYPDAVSARSARAAHDMHKVDDAKRFLHMLDPEAASFTFQTFDDSGQKRSALAAIRHGEFAQVSRFLEAQQSRGAGAFVTVNATDGAGRQEHNVKRVRAVFVDLDGAPLEPVLRGGLSPQIIAESSPGKYHCYWLTDDCPLDQFERVQRALARKFDGDPSVNDLPRVMRLPGFQHLKGDPQTTRLLPDLCTEVPPYAISEIVGALNLELDAVDEAPAPQGHPKAGKVEIGRRHAHLFRSGRSMAKRGLSRAAVLAALTAENVAQCDPSLPDTDIAYLADRAFTAKDAAGWEIGSRRDASPPDEAIPHPDLSDASEAVVRARELPEPRDLWRGYAPGPFLDTANALPAILAEIVEPIAESRGHDVGALGMSVVCALSACLRQRSRIAAHPSISTWTEGSALWGALIGESGHGKSPSMQFAVAPLNAIERTNFGAFKQAKEASGKDEKVPPPARLIAADCTVEALGTHYASSDRRILNFRDEGTGFINGMGRYNGRGDAERADWCSAWNCNPHTIDRLSRPSLHHEDWGVSVLMGLTPSQMKEAAAEARQDGLLARMLQVMVRPVSGKETPSSAAHTAANEYDRLARAVYSLGVITATPDHAAADAMAEARTHFAEAAEVFSGNNKQMAVWMRKAAANTLRVALVFSAVQAAAARMNSRLGSDIAPIVDERTAARAIRFVNWSACHALAFSEINVESPVLILAQRVGLFVLAREADVVSRRDLQRYVGAWASEQDERVRGQAILHLFDAGWLLGSAGTRLVRGPGISEATAWHVNPLAFDHFADYGAAEIARRREVRTRMQSLGGANE